MPTKKNNKKTPLTVITLTLPDEGGIQRTGSLLIQRGDLARLYQFYYCNAGDITSAITGATRALAALEKFPPVIGEAAAGGSVQETSSRKAAPKPEDEEPTVDLPVRAGPVAVKISHLKIVAGDADAAAYRRATLIGARLIEAGLWNGQSPIGIRDAHRTYAQIQDLDDDALGAMPLADIVQTDDERDETNPPDPLSVDGETNDSEPLATHLLPSADGSQQMTIF